MRKPSSKDKILDMLKNNVGKIVDNNTIRNNVGISDWARVLRTLRQEGWDIESKNNKGYVLYSLEKKSGIQRKSINQKTRYLILARDESTCQKCGKSSPNVELEVDHKIPVNIWDKKNGDPNQIENLWTLCSMCNHGKRDFFSDEEIEIMKNVQEQSTGMKKLEIYFKAQKNKIISPTKLAVISGIRDWPRTVRYLRDKGMDIQWMGPKHDGGPGYAYRS